MNTFDPLGLEPGSYIWTYTLPDGSSPFEGEFNAYKKVLEDINESYQKMIDALKEAGRCTKCTLACSIGAYTVSWGTDYIVNETGKSFGKQYATKFVVSKITQKALDVYNPASKVNLSKDIAECVLNCNLDEDYDLSWRAIGDYLNSKLPDLPGKMRWF